MTSSGRDCCVGTTTAVPTAASAETLEKDHVVMLTRGGRHAISNILPACKACNISKFNHLLSEWRYARRSPCLATTSRATIVMSVSVRVGGPLAALSGGSMAAEEVPT